MFAHHRQTTLSENPDKRNHRSAALVHIIPPHSDYSKKGRLSHSLRGQGFGDENDNFWTPVAKTGVLDHGEHIQGMRHRPVCSYSGSPPWPPLARCGGAILAATATGTLPLTVLWGAGR